MLYILLKLFDVLCSLLFTETIFSTAAGNISLFSLLMLVPSYVYPSDSKISFFYISELAPLQVRSYINSKEFHFSNISCLEPIFLGKTPPHFELVVILFHAHYGLALYYIPVMKTTYTNLLNNYFFHCWVVTSSALSSQVFNSFCK